MKQKSDIPNQNGFRLVLIRNNGQRIPCVVSTRKDGSFACFNIHTQKPVSDSIPWEEFAGWEELPQKTPLELHAESLPAFDGMRKLWQCLFTKDQLRDKPIPKKGHASIVAGLNRLERITLAPFKSTENKPLYLLEHWSNC